MKTFKQVDFWIQITLMATGLLLLAFQHQLQLGDSFFSSYLVLGGWQTISVIVHFFFPATAKCKLRTIYLLLLALTIAGGVFYGIFMSNDLLEYMFYMLFWTPILALLYIVTCAIENNQLKKA